MRVDAEHLATVMRMVVECVEDRAPEEVAALEALAAALDADRNRMAHSNRRLDWSGDPVPCTYTTAGPHPASNAEARRLGLPARCKCDGTGLVRPFADGADDDALTDDHGWSIALHAVRAW